jgi:hypothetical protein
MYGEISGNTVYNISGIHNAGEGDSYDADGLYCDGCAYVTFEQNLVHNVDYGIEVASEHRKCLSNGTEWSGPNDTGVPGTGTYPCNGRYVTVRNNVVYGSNACGISIGGYANDISVGPGDRCCGGSSQVVIVNHTLYNNSTKNQAGEFQIQYHSGEAQGNIFENNIVDAGTYNTWIDSFVKPTEEYPAPQQRLTGTCTTPPQVILREPRSSGPERTTSKPTPPIERQPEKIPIPRTQVLCSSIWEPLPPTLISLVHRRPSMLGASASPAAQAGATAILLTRFTAAPISPAIRG